MRPARRCSAHRPTPTAQKRTCRREPPCHTGELLRLQLAYLSLRGPRQLHKQYWVQLVCLCKCPRSVDEHLRLEHAYPLKMRRYRLREGSGGVGLHRGGEGIVREVELLGKARLSLITERRTRAPYGLQGGEEGKVGQNILVRDGREEVLPGKCSIEGRKGDRLIIRTPGGGGWGKEEEGE